MRQEPAGARARRGPELLQARFGQRLRELLPAGDLVLSRPLLGPDVSADAEAAGRVTWTQAGRVVEFALRVELTPSLQKIQALPQADLTQQPVQVLLAPRLTKRTCLRLERLGWSYWVPDGPMLIQHHDPLIAIRVVIAPSTADDRRIAQAAAGWPRAVPGRERATG